MVRFLPRATAATALLPAQQPHSRAHLPHSPHTQTERALCCRRAEKNKQTNHFSPLPSDSIIPSPSVLQILLSKGPPAEAAAWLCLWGLSGLCPGKFA